MTLHNLKISSELRPPLHIYNVHTVKKSEHGRMQIKVTATYYTMENLSLSFPAQFQDLLTSSEVYILTLIFKYLKNRPRIIPLQKYINIR